MDTPESNRSHSSKHDSAEKLDSGDGKIECDEDRERADRRQSQSSNSRKHIDELVEKQDSGKRRRSGGSGRADSRDEGDYDSRRESQSKIRRKNPDELIPSEGYCNKEDDDNLKNSDEHESNSFMKTSTRPSDHESSQGRSSGKTKTYREGDLEKVHDRDSRYSERKESSSRERSHELVVDGTKDDGSGYNDTKHEPTRDRTPGSRYESCEDKSSAVNLTSERDVRSAYTEERQTVDLRHEDSRSSYREEKVTDRESRMVQSSSQDEYNSPVAQPLDAEQDDRQTKAKERSVWLVEDAVATVRPSTVTLPNDKEDKYRQQRGSGYDKQDDTESKEWSISIDEDGHTRTRDESGLEVGHIKRSGSPERSGWHQRGSNEHDRGAWNDIVKEFEKENNGDYEKSSKENGSSWNDNSPRDQWRSSQSRQDRRDSDREYANVKESDSQRREQERLDSEMLHGRPGFRRDSRTRPEDGKSSSGFRNVYGKSDSIEIKPIRNLDFEREASVSTLHMRKNEGGPHQDFASGMREEEQRDQSEGRDMMTYAYADDLPERFKDDVSQDDKGRGQKGPMDSSGSHPQVGDNQGPGTFNRGPQQGPKGGRPGRGRRMTGRDVQRAGTPLPMMPPPFNPLGLSPGQLQPLVPNMPHPPFQSMAPGLFFPPLTGPLVWPGARAVDLHMLAMPANLPPIPPPAPGAPPRFSPIMGNGLTHPMFLNQPSPGRGALSNVSGPGFSSPGPVSRGSPHEKAPMGWITPRTSAPAGKAPSRGEQNDYSQNFVDTGMRPQNFIRELELTNTVEDYPKLRELIQRKDEIVAKASTPPMYYKCDLHDFVLTPEFFGTKFDVILVDPPWEEYVHRAPGVTDHLEYWQLEEIQNLKIEAIADTPSFIFLWVGDGVGLEQGRQCLKKWGFRRCEDICWVKTNKRNATPGLRHDSRTLFQHSKEHCLMGIKGTVRRSTDGHIIHANIDTDIIIAEEPADGSTKKPEDMYRIIEHFALGKRRLELFGEDHNIRSGWLTLGKRLSSSNFNTEAYVRSFADREGKVWQGGGGRNPPPETGHLVVTTPEIEGLRPKSPPPKNQQQSSMSLMTTGSSGSRRPSPQRNAIHLDGSMSEPATPAHWASSPMVGGVHGVSDDKFYDAYRLDPSCIQAVGDRIEIDPRRALNML